MCVHLWVCSYTHVSTEHVRVCVHVKPHVCLLMCTCEHVSMHVSVCICSCACVWL